jgi:regulatory protein spx
VITIYVSPSCSSCRKVKKWFDDNHIPYEAKNIFSPSLSAEDIRDLISKTENGTDDIISPRSKIVPEQNIDFDSMKISELIAFIQKNPSILKRPIIVDDHRVQVGYNEEEIRTFIPRARRLAERYCSPEECENYASCHYCNPQAQGEGVQKP